MIFLRTFFVLYFLIGQLLLNRVTSLKWGFSENGYHMHFFIEHNSDLTEEHYTFQLPPSFFISLEEVEEQYVIISNDNKADATSEYYPVLFKTDFLCDIEAPAFNIHKNNTVSIELKRKKITAHHNVFEVRKLVFPVHARYESLSHDTSTFLSFFKERKAHVTSCITGVHASSNNTTLELFEENEDTHCRNIPVPYLEDLSFVHASLMFVLLLGAGIAILSLSFD